MNEKTATDHAATVRRAISKKFNDPAEASTILAHAALDALVAQAETAEERIQDAKYVGFNRMQQRAEAAEAERDAAVRTAEQAREALQRGIDIAAQYLDTGRGDLDGWIESTRAALTKDTP